MINWIAFDWQSFATLFVGIAAIGGATLVGLKQAKIAKNQNDILHRQVRLEETRLRSELYNRRMAVFEEVASYMDGVLKGQIPEEDLWHAGVSGKFLFGDSKSVIISQVQTKANRYMSIRSELERLEESGTHDNKDALSLKTNISKLEKESTEAYIQLSELRITLHLFFANDLDLSYKDTGEIRAELDDLLRQFGSDRRNMEL